MRKVIFTHISVVITFGFILFYKFINFNLYKKCLIDYRNKIKTFEEVAM